MFRYFLNIGIKYVEFSLQYLRMVLLFSVILVIYMMFMSFVRFDNHGMGRRGDDPSAPSGSTEIHVCQWYRDERRGPRSLNSVNFLEIRAYMNNYSAAKGYFGFKKMSRNI